MTGRPTSLLWINHFAVSPRDGGGTRHFELARELGCRGWRVTVAASDFHYHTRNYTRRPGVDHRDPVAEHLDGVDFLWLWSAPYTRNDWRRGWNWITFGQSLSRWQANGSAPRVVIGSSPHLFAALAGARMASRLGVPFVLEVRDLWPESLLAAGGRKGAVYHAFGAIARYLYRRADRIIVLARGSADHIGKMGVPADKIVYVPNGADVGAFKELPLHPDARETFTLVYAGAHGPANGLETVLGAAELLLRENSRVRFLLVGDGPTKAELQASAAARSLSNVEFRDPVSKREVPALLASADAGLMVLRDAPLFSHGVSPNKLFDYFAASLPVVCNVPGDVAGMVREAAAGEQAADCSARALADAVLRLASRSLEDLATMGRSAREWVAREHGRPVLAERLDAALRQLVGA